MVVDQCRRLGHVDGGVLDVADVLHLAGERAHGVGIEVDARRDREVVDHHRDVDGTGDGTEVGQGLRDRERLVVRRHRHDHVGAGRLGVAGEPDGLGRARGACLRDHRHSSRGPVDDGLDHQAPLVAGQRAELPGGAARHDPVHPCVDRPVDRCPQQCHVDAAVRVERGGQCGQDAAKLDCHLVLLWDGQPVASGSPRTVRCWRSVASRLAASCAAENAVAIAVSV